MSSDRSKQELEREVARLQKRVNELETERERQQGIAAQIRLLLEGTQSDWVAVCDQEGRITEASTGVEQTTGYTSDEMRGRTPGQLWKSGQMDEGVYQELKQALEAGQPYHNVFVNRRKNGELFMLDQTISPIVRRGADGTAETVNYVASGRELDASQQMERDLRYLALIDPLTELPNRTLFNDLLGRAVAGAKRDDQHLALMLVDVNRFVYVNESFGAEVGDQVLRRLAQRLRKLAGEANLVARMGADEYAILLSQVESLEDVVLFADKVRSEAARPFTVQGTEVVLTVSIGVSLFPDDGAHTQQLMSRASIALSKARKLGRGECIFFKERMNREAVEFLRLKEGVFAAQQQDEFEVHFQPYFCLRTQRMAGMEALARWRSPRLGTVPPARFIPILEDTGLIRQVGRRIAELVCEQLGKWRKLGMRVPIALNLSAGQFRDDDLVEGLVDVTKRYGVSPEDLILEITESTFMDDLEHTNRILRQLKGHGFRIAIDDFGTGYSSLSYLRRLPVDLLKIDLSFIREIGKSVEDASIVRAVVSMAHSLDLKTVAEGVENAGHLLVLQGLRCDIGQGYLWSRALPAAELEKAFPLYFGANAPAPACDDESLFNDETGPMPMLA